MAVTGYYDIEDWDTCSLTKSLTGSLADWTNFIGWTDLDGSEFQRKWRSGALCCWLHPLPPAEIYEGRCKSWAFVHWEVGRRPTHWPNTRNINRNRASNWPRTTKRSSQGNPAGSILSLGLILLSRDIIANRNKPRKSVTASYQQFSSSSVDPVKKKNYGTES